jgi:hypothetical protein
VLRRTILVVLASAAALAVAVSAGGAGASGERQRAPAEDQLLETITVSVGASITSETDFQPSETYKVVFSGSMHTQCEKGRPFFGATHDEDVFYVYNAADQNGPLPGPPQINFFFTGRLFYRTSLPPFSEGHTYTGVPPADLRGRFVFADAYPVSQLEHCTRTGAWTVRIYRVESGTTKTVSEPAPGRSTYIESPNLPVDCGTSPGRALSSALKPNLCELSIANSTGDLRGTTIVGEGDVEKVPRTPGAFVFWCWLNVDLEDDAGAVIQLTPTEQLHVCIDMAVRLFSRGDLGAPRPALVRRSAGAPVEKATSGCRSKSIPISLRKRKGKGKVVALGRAKHAKLKASSVRYSCSASGGLAKITIKGPRGLRKAVGKKLNLTVVRAKKAPRRSGKLTFTFGW